MNGHEKKEELETTPLIVTLVYVPPTGRSFRQANDHDGGGERSFSQRRAYSLGAIVVYRAFALTRLKR